MRQIALDTETTGLSHKSGDRIIEIGCVELVDLKPTGVVLHHYLDPEGWPVNREAERVHGISNAMLEGRPIFADIALDLVQFIGDAQLVIHNAAFDTGFLNAELARAGLGPIDKAQVIDSLAMARQKHPGSPASLDSLCKRYRIDGAKRTYHGALLDAWLLAEVYIEMVGGRQSAFELALQVQEVVPLPVTARPRPLAPRLTEDDVAAHRAFVEELGPSAQWRRYAY